MRPTLSSILFILILACTTSEAGAQERREIPAYREIGLAENSQSRAELHSFLDAFRTAWGHEDTPALMALHVDDTEWINAYARMFTDSNSLGRFLETRLFPNFAPGVSRMEADNMQAISIRLLGNDAAVIHLYTDGNRGPSVIEERELRRTHIHLVLTRVDERWLIAHTAIMDARQ
ncbi:hypothetical protein V0U79_09190 [Hyphobacterium sp. HN65]|uniref:SnoaL-like domain-containing protein n=1 Tax=Hyphobacterium lacteum TaxID=3116575 RepID=A0ABU7LRK0_9PROT|nr:hypothetical protein [Hyphobacterium sp. HN65]MEE2526540.1 hypothetical protein [Hyphobacterium sp. HN65]